MRPMGHVLLKTKNPAKVWRQIGQRTELRIHREKVILTSATLIN